MSIRGDRYHVGLSYYFSCLPGHPARRPGAGVTAQLTAAVAAHTMPGDLDLRIWMAAPAGARKGL
jgi:hypothetical protein